MTDDMKDFDLENLWQSEKGEIDMEMILDTRDRLERGRVLGRRIYDGALLLFAFMVLLYGSLEFSGILKTGGWLTGGFFGYFCCMVALTMRRRRKNPEIAGLSPQGLLENAIDRAENNLRVARTLYAIFPATELIGAGVGYSSAGSILDYERGAILPLSSIIIFLLIVALGNLAAIIFGLRLAKRKQAELKVLRARLADIAGDTE